MRTSLTIMSVALLAAAAGLTGCGGSVDKNGAPANAAPTVLKIGAADPDEAELAFFTKALPDASGNRLRAEVDPTTYFSETPGGEAKLAADLRSGTVPFAWIPSRDWAAAGDKGFQALQAPGLVTRTSGAASVAADPVAGELLSGAKDLGAEGLALVPGEARRLITREPVTSLADLKGDRIRINDSAQTAGVISALGGVPKQGMTADAASTALGQGELDGVETAPVYISSNSYNESAPYLSSFGLFPKFEVLLANSKAWKALSADDQKAIRQAAALTVRHAATEVPAQETRELSDLCDHGMIVVKPSDDALGGISTAITGSRSTDPAVAAMVSRISAVLDRAAAPAGTDAPQLCQVTSSAQDAEAAHAASIAPRPAGSAARKLLAGTYEVTITKDEWAQARILDPEFQQDITFTTTLGPDGRYVGGEKPDLGPDVTGGWTVNGDEIRFDSDAGPTHDDTVRWSYYKGVLRLQAVSVQDDVTKVVYGQPWHRAG